MNETRSVYWGRNEARSIYWGRNEAQGVYWGRNEEALDSPPIMPELYDSTVAAAISLKDDSRGDNWNY